MSGALDLTPLRGLQISHAQFRRRQPTDRAAGVLRDALAKTAERSRQGRRNFFPLTLNTLCFECRCIEERQRAHSEAF